jgi:hypothetical protein
VNVLQAHAKVFLDLLDADNATPPLVVLHGRVPQGQTAPYVLLYIRLHTPSGVEVPQMVSLESTSDVIDASAYCHSVANLDPMGALAVAGRVRARLLGVTPTVAGRACYPISHEDSRPMDRNDELGSAVFDQVDVYSFTSQPG